MKKLVLKKDVVARINDDQMNLLKGGAGTYSGTSILVCPTDECTQVYDTCKGTCKDDASCPGHNTCNGANTCGDPTCAFLCSIRTCGGQY